MTRSLILTGFTASGKSDVAVTLARDLGAEIVNLDSRQVYRGLETGTAVPGPAALAAVPHHLYAIASPASRWSLGRHLTLVREVLGDVHARGRAAILVGGPSLYLEAVIRGYQPHGPSPYREELERRLALEGLEALAADLGRVDPVAAARINLRNPRRVVRALEVALQGGSMGQGRSSGTDAMPVLLLTVPDAELRARITRRTATMLDGGMLEEAAWLMMTHGPDAPAWSGIGYRDAWLIASGRLARGEGEDRINRATWNLVRRQRSWLRRVGTCQAAGDPDELLAAARELVTVLRPGAL